MSKSKKSGKHISGDPRKRGQKYSTPKCLREENRIRELNGDFDFSVEKCNSLNIPEIDYPMIEKVGLEKYLLSNELYELDKKQYGKYKGFPICPSIFHMFFCDTEEIKSRIEWKKMMVKGKSPLCSIFRSNVVHNDFGTFLLKDNYEVEMISPDRFNYLGEENYNYYELFGLCG